MYPNLHSLDNLGVIPKELELLGREYSAITRCLVLIILPFCTENLALDTTEGSLTESLL